MIFSARNSPIIVAICLTSSLSSLLFSQTFAFLQPSTISPTPQTAIRKNEESSSSSSLHFTSSIHSRTRTTTTTVLQQAKDRFDILQDLAESSNGFQNLMDTSEFQDLIALADMYETELESLKQDNSILVQEKEVLMEKVQTMKDRLKEQLVNLRAINDEYKERQIREEEEQQRLQIEQQRRQQIEQEQIEQEKQRLGLQIKELKEQRMLMERMKLQQEMEQAKKKQMIQEKRRVILEQQRKQVEEQKVQRNKLQEQREKMESMQQRRLLSEEVKKIEQQRQRQEAQRDQQRKEMDMQRKQFMEEQEMQRKNMQEQQRKQMKNLQEQQEKLERERKQLEQLKLRMQQQQQKEQELELDEKLKQQRIKLQSLMEQKQKEQDKQEEKLQREKNILQKLIEQQQLTQQQENQKLQNEKQKLQQQQIQQNNQFDEMKRNIELERKQMDDIKEKRLKEQDLLRQQLEEKRIQIEKERKQRQLQEAELERRRDIEAQQKEIEREMDKQQQRAKEKEENAKKEQEELLRRKREEEMKKQQEVEAKRKEEEEERRKKEEEEKVRLEQEKIKQAELQKLEQQRQKEERKKQQQIEAQKQREEEERRQKEIDLKQIEAQKEGERRKEMELQKKQEEGRQQREQKMKEERQNIDAQRKLGQEEQQRKQEIEAQKRKQQEEEEQLKRKQEMERQQKLKQQQEQEELQRKQQEMERQQKLKQEEEEIRREIEFLKEKLKKEEEERRQIEELQKAKGKRELTPIEKLRLQQQQQSNDDSGSQKQRVDDIEAQLKFLQEKKQKRDGSSEIKERIQQQQKPSTKPIEPKIIDATKSSSKSTTTVTDISKSTSSSSKKNANQGIFQQFGTRMQQFFPKQQQTQSSRPKAFVSSSPGLSQNSTTTVESGNTLQKVKQSWTQTLKNTLIKPNEQEKKPFKWWEPKDAITKQSERSSNGKQQSVVRPRGASLETNATVEISTKPSNTTTTQKADDDKKLEWWEPRNRDRNAPAETIKPDDKVNVRPPPQQQQNMTSSKASAKPSVEIEKKPKEPTVSKAAVKKPSERTTEPDKSRAMFSWSKQQKETDTRKPKESQSKEMTNEVKITTPKLNDIDLKKSSKYSASNVKSSSVDTVPFKRNGNIDVKSRKVLDVKTSIKSSKIKEQTTIPKSQNATASTSKKQIANQNAKSSAFKKTSTDGGKYSKAAFVSLRQALRDNPIMKKSESIKDKLQSKSDFADRSKGDDNSKAMVVATGALLVVASVALRVQNTDEAITGVLLRDFRNTVDSFIFWAQNINEIPELASSPMVKRVVSDEVSEVMKDISLELESLFYSSGANQVLSEISEVAKEAADQGKEYVSTNIAPPVLEILDAVEEKLEKYGEISLEYVKEKFKEVGPVEVTTDRVAQNIDGVSKRSWETFADGFLGLLRLPMMLFSYIKFLFFSFYNLIPDPMVASVALEGIREFVLDVLYTIAFSVVVAPILFVNYFLQGSADTLRNVGLWSIDLMAGVEFLPKVAEAKLQGQLEYTKADLLEQKSLWLERAAMLNDNLEKMFDVGDKGFVEQGTALLERTSAFVKDLPSVVPNAQSNNDYVNESDEMMLVALQQVPMAVMTYFQDLFAAFLNFLPDFKNLKSSFESLPSKSQGVSEAATFSLIEAPLTEIMQGTADIIRSVIEFFMEIGQNLDKNFQSVGEQMQDRLKFGGNDGGGFNSLSERTEKLKNMLDTLPSNLDSQLQQLENGIDETKKKLSEISVQSLDETSKKISEISSQSDQIKEPLEKQAGTLRGKDLTGSLSSYFEETKQNMQDTMERLKERSPDFTKNKFESIKQSVMKQSVDNTQNANLMGDSDSVGQTLEGTQDMAKNIIDDIKQAASKQPVDSTENFEITGNIDSTGVTSEGTGFAEGNKKMIEMTEEAASSDVKVPLDTLESNIKKRTERIQEKDFTESFSSYFEQSKQFMHDTMERMKGHSPDSTTNKLESIKQSVDNAETAKVLGDVDSVGQTFGGAEDIAQNRIYDMTQATATQAGDSAKTFDIPDVIDSIKESSEGTDFAEDPKKVIESAEASSNLDVKTPLDDLELNSESVEGTNEKMEPNVEEMSPSAASETDSAAEQVANSNFAKESVDSGSSIDEQLLEEKTKITSPMEKRVGSKQGKDFGESMSSYFEQSKQYMHDTMERFKDHSPDSAKNKIDSVKQAVDSPESAKVLGEFDLGGETFGGAEDIAQNQIEGMTKATATQSVDSTETIDIPNVSDSTGEPSEGTGLAEETTKIFDSTKESSNSDFKVSADDLESNNDSLQGTDQKVAPKQGKDFSESMSSYFEQTKQYMHDTMERFKDHSPDLAKSKVDNIKQAVDSTESAKVLGEFDSGGQTFGGAEDISQNKIEGMTQTTATQSADSSETIDIPNVFDSTGEPSEGTGLAEDATKIVDSTKESSNSGLKVSADDLESNIDSTQGTNQKVAPNAEEIPPTVAKDSVDSGSSIEDKLLKKLFGGD